VRKIARRLVADEAVVRDGIPRVDVELEQGAGLRVQLYAADWRAWFPHEGDPRHGTPDDPRIVLIGIEVHAAVYFEVDKPVSVVLYETAKGWLSGTMPDIGEMHIIRPAQEV
jgi:hypothetical protein